jgi:hypothetical protein
MESTSGGVSPVSEMQAPLSEGDPPLRIASTDLRGSATGTTSELAGGNGEAAEPTGERTNPDAEPGTDRQSSGKVGMKKQSVALQVFQGIGLVLAPFLSAMLVVGMIKMFCMPSSIATASRMPAATA